MLISRDFSAHAAALVAPDASKKLLLILQLGTGVDKLRLSFSGSVQWQCALLAGHYAFLYLPARLGHEDHWPVVEAPRKPVGCCPCVCQRLSRFVNILQSTAGHPSWGDLK